ncbi:MBL fold metallo-hydrolase [Glutamicibacter sp. PS]|uniref:MBL fold metallo-hydrolase n=1 Tax=Glutamicibacter sp. PS TaxID=3075634 RepID=UPI00284EC6FC|nr:MBL fold metallo-hydrolase [Glutamicibacter sp. PS]MDR4531921.1 MBL fold metallo-hydrolase [Glutamicibacter sp. PS]
MFQQLSDTTAVLRAPNPSPMTLTGTNSYLLGEHGPRPAAPVVVIDPGPEQLEHLQALAAYDIRLVLITHRHADHTAGIDTLHDLTGTPVAAADAKYCRHHAPLRDGQLITQAGVRLRVLATPGHTADSLCFVNETPGAPAELFSGDTLLGEGTTVLDYPDGTLGDYLASLARLAALPEAALRPGHGSKHARMHPVIEQYRLHREQRLEALRQAIEWLRSNGQDPSRENLLARVYPEVPAHLLGAAEKSLDAQLHYLDRA